MNSGSRWMRWDPHMHAPGTVLNDQFKGKDPWSDYLTALEESTPVISAIGVTDYYSITAYEKVCAEKAAGRLPECELIFPNIEMRLGVGTVKGSWLNIHLLVNPRDSDHVEQVQRILGRLTFKAHDDSFSCSKDELIRLGKKFDSSIQDDSPALAAGTQQFKVTFDQLKQVMSESAWATKNILIAVAGGADGTSGVRESADKTLREEVEKFAHIVFASSPSQRDFWLGRKALDEAALKARYGGVKPCMHGSDAHGHSDVGKPAENRYSWIKGAPHFDTLLQCCIDPAGRAFVGIEPPMSSTPSQVIQNIEITGTSWLKTSSIELNPGLVAIIGARGSGKTALADMIALGCDATAEHLTQASFLVRARDLLSGGDVNLKWGLGDDSKRALDCSDSDFPAQYSRARYLSQQFVEELCSATGMTDSLIEEIERVIFESHSLSERDGAVDFHDLLEIRARRFREARSREESNLSGLSERISSEIEKHQLIPNLKKSIEKKEKLLNGYTEDRKRLVPKGGEKKVERLNLLTSAAEKIRGYVRAFTEREQSLLRLEDEVNNFRTQEADEALRQTRERYSSVGFVKDSDWAPFLKGFIGDVDSVIARGLKTNREGAVTWRGKAPKLDAANPLKPLIAGDAALEKQTLSLLEAEIERLKKEISSDQDTANKFATLTKKITEEESSLKGLKEKLEDYMGAMSRAKSLVVDRQSAYKRVFDSILEEQTVLEALYKPLIGKLSEAQGTLQKLSFSVKRVANVVKWASEGESLLDLRSKGPFKGKGTLLQYAEMAFGEVWKTGTSDLIEDSMKGFRDSHESELLEHSPFPKSNSTGYRSWTQRYAKWLYSTEHISVHYSIDYDGVEIQKLSPGTRGIVLLLLYLALDSADDRPLIIDQPEENLDPKSVYDELVHLFLEVKKKRQVIMVTHNANLVVNTDADQIIIAEAGHHPPNSLPPISYVSGGLEDESIRENVCDILEGGDIAFKERARRLRVQIKR